MTVTYVAWDTAANAGKTGDVANHTLRWVKDGTSSAPTNSPAEVDATNAPGVYKLVLTATECTCDVGTLAGKSSTASVSLMPLTIAFEQLPTAAPGASTGVPVLDAGLRVKADVERWLAGTPDALSSGKVASDLKLWLASAPNVLISGRVDAAAQVVGDKTGYALTAAYDPAKTASQAGDQMALTAAARAAIWDEVVELAYTARQLLRLLAAAEAGKTSGMATTNPKMRDLGDTKNRVDGTVDVDGNRTAVVLDLT